MLSCVKDSQRKTGESRGIWNVSKKKTLKHKLRKDTTIADNQAALQHNWSVSECSISNTLSICRPHPGRVHVQFREFCRKTGGYDGMWTETYQQVTAVQIVSALATLAASVISAGNTAQAWPNCSFHTWSPHNATSLVRKATTPLITPKTIRKKNMKHRYQASLKQWAGWGLDLRTS